MTDEEKEMRLEFMRRKGLEVSSSIFFKLKKPIKGLPREKIPGTLTFYDDGSIGIKPVIPLAVDITEDMVDLRSIERVGTIDGALYILQYVVMSFFIFIKIKTLDVLGFNKSKD